MQKKKRLATLETFLKKKNESEPSDTEVTEIRNFDFSR